MNWLEGQVLVQGTSTIDDATTSCEVTCVMIIKRERVAGEFSGS